MLLKKIKNAQEALNHLWFKENRSKILFNRFKDEA